MACSIIAFCGVWWNVGSGDGTPVHIVGDDAPSDQWVYGAMVSSAVALAFAVVAVVFSFVADFSSVPALHYGTLVMHTGAAAAATAAFSMVVSHTWELRDSTGIHYGFTYGFAFEILTAAFGIIGIFVSAMCAKKAAENSPRRDSNLDKGQWNHNAPQNNVNNV
eukprot:CAMPEP_0171497514 /NCGR_PEP_ID=MMETSP0958-20121227/7320_1 /TAXON_ID=87120 /ORGANISM="Aurantiochytrium limacinum, Strain ATCCMYA-1381" /LENGTH=163 /DNA_ID=CAMNT_0012031777 /DNA_START=176 /DNA_END=667 /DNA_ORIENTATION=+